MRKGNKLERCIHLCLTVSQELEYFVWKKMSNSEIKARQTKKLLRNTKMTGCNPAPAFNASFFCLFQVFLVFVRVSYSLHTEGSDASISGYFFLKFWVQVSRTYITRSIKCVIYLNCILVQFPIVNFSFKFERWIWYLQNQCFQKKTR